MPRFDDDDYDVLPLEPNGYDGYIDLTAPWCVYWISPKGEIVTFFDTAAIVEFLHEAGCELDDLYEIFPSALPGARLDWGSDIHSWLDIEFCKRVTREG